MRPPVRVPIATKRRRATSVRDRARTSQPDHDCRPPRESPRLVWGAPPDADRAEERFRDELRDSRAKTIAPRTYDVVERGRSKWPRSRPQEFTCRDGRCWLTADLSKPASS
jgi:hypothetical protein